MEEEEEMELKEVDHRALLPPCSPTLPIPSKYTLSSGAASHSNRSPSYSISGRSKHKASLPSSSSSTTTSELCMYRSPWQEEVGHDELPSIRSSDHIQTLLSQLASSISAMKRAFAHLQAMLRADSDAKGARSVTAPATTIMAENIMVEELQRLSDVHTRLYSVLQEHGVMKQDMNGSPESRCMQEYVCRDNADKPQDAGMLKSYEGIISRFYDEIKKKDAVAEALKETLAKSMLKGEKLERRVKFLEAKLSLK